MDRKPDTERHWIDLEQTPEPVVVHQRGRIRYANPEARTLLGLDATALADLDPARLLHSQERQALLERHRRILGGERGLTDNTFRVRTKGGTVLHVRSHSARILFDGAPATLHFFHPLPGLPQDAASAETSFRLLTETASDVLWVLDAQTRRFTYVSPAVEALRGFTAEEAMAQTLEESLDPESALKVAELLARTAEILMADRTRDLRQILEIRQPCKDGSLVWVEASTRSRVDAEGRLEVVGVSRNIEERKKAEQDLVRRSYHDELTGLYNRHYLNTRLPEEVERSERYGVPISMALFDLDHFKALNDTWGHAAGDEHLRKVAATVGSVIRESDILVRLGGEEFLALFPQTGEPGAAIAAEKMRRALEGCLGPAESAVTSSFGVAERRKGEAVSSWMRRLDAALYCAKDQGRNRVEKASGLGGKYFHPVQFEWRPKWECGHPTIDGEHRELLTLTNQLLQNLSAEPTSEQTLAVLDHLLTQTARHFKDEERVLAGTDYADRDSHAKLHDGLVEQAESVKARFLNGLSTSTEVFGFLVDELVIGHMLTADIQFFSAVRNLKRRGEE